MLRSISDQYDEQIRSTYKNKCPKILLKLLSWKTFEIYILKKIYFIFRHGTQKVATGVGLIALGAVTNNQNIAETGTALATLGVATKVGAHLLPDQTNNWGRWNIKL